MTQWTLLKGEDRRGWALYQDSVLVANYSHNDYREYIDGQIESRAGSDCELVEKDHKGPFPEKLEAKKPVKKPVKKAEPEA